MKSTSQSVEPFVADLVNGWLKSYDLDYKLEQGRLNDAIDKALDEYCSKTGGGGGTVPMQNFSFGIPPFAIGRF